MAALPCCVVAHARLHTPSTHPAPSSIPPAAAEAAGSGAGHEGDLDSRAAAAGAPKHFFCPISLQIMRDPVVVAATGQTWVLLLLLPGCCWLALSMCWLGIAGWALPISTCCLLAAFAAGCHCSSCWAEAHLDVPIAAECSFR